MQDDLPVIMDHKYIPSAPDFHVLHGLSSDGVLMVTIAL